MTTALPSSLEIAQAATLRPIEEIAALAGLEPDEVEPYGRTKAKIDLAVLDRLKGTPDGKLVCVTAITPTKAGEGKTTTSVSLDAGPRPHRPQAGALPARGLARAGLRDQGRRGRRRLRPGRADGGPEPPLHRRHPRDRRGEQPARRDARGAHPARQRARDRPALGRLAALRRHQRPRARATVVVGVGGRANGYVRETRLRHHRRLRGDGDRRRRPRPARSARSGSARSRSRTPSRASPCSPSSCRRPAR